MTLRRLIVTFQSTALYHAVGNLGVGRTSAGVYPEVRVNAVGFCLSFQSLTYASKKAATLFNLGIVKWQSKKDGPGAVTAWKKLLATIPAYTEKEAVLPLMAKAHHR